MKVTLNKNNYLPHQWLFLKDTTTPILGLISGYGGGKTYSFVRKVFLFHLTKLNKDGQSSGAIAYPKLSMAKSLFVKPFLYILKKYGIAYKYDKHVGKIITKYGTVDILTMKRASLIVGLLYTYAGCDLLDIERPLIALLTVDKLMGRLRGCNDAQLFIVSTPLGFKYTYRLFVLNNLLLKDYLSLELIKNISNEILRKMITASTYDNPFLPDDYISKLLAKYDAKRIQMYLLGKFVNLNGTQAVYNFDRNLHTIDKRNDIPNDELVYIGMDFNVNPMTALVVYKTYTNGIVSFYVDELIVLPNSNTYMMVDNIKLNYQGRRFRTICDVSGKSRKTSSYQTDFKILQLAGLDPIGRKISLRDKLNNMNMLFKQGRILINKQCKVTIRDMLSVTLDDDGKIDCRDKRLTHALDALGYLVYILNIKPRDIRGY